MVGELNCYGIQSGRLAFLQLCQHGLVHIVGGAGQVAGRVRHQRLINGGRRLAAVATYSSKMSLFLDGTEF